MSQVTLLEVSPFPLAILAEHPVWPKRGLHELHSRVNTQKHVPQQLPLARQVGNFDRVAVDCLVDMDF